MVGNEKLQPCHASPKPGPELKPAQRPGGSPQHQGEGTPGQGTARKDHGLWGRCLTPAMLVSEETTRQRGSLLLTLGCFQPSQHQPQLGTGHLQHQERLQGTPLYPAPSAGRVGRALHGGALSPQIPVQTRGKGRLPGGRQLQQCSHLPTAQAEPRQRRSKPQMSQERGEHPRMGCTQGSPPEQAPLKMTLVPDSSRALSLSSPLAHHTMWSPQ